MNMGDGWFTEVCEECGSALSLRVKNTLHDEQTPFQRIQVYDTETYGTLMVIDGFVMFATRDHFIYHEMLVHPALFTHKQPRRVVIVGGGDCGSLHEVLKHPQVERATQVEIDERVTRIAETYFPELCASNEDPRARFVFTDAIEWMAQQSAESADVVIIDSTDPVGPAAGLFSADFYTQCRRVLGPDGVLVQQSESPLFHMNIIEPMHRNMRRAGFAQTRSLHFPQSSYPSGWWTVTLGAEAAGDFRQADVNEREFATRYYNADMHRASLATPEFLRPTLAS